LDNDLRGRERFTVAVAQAIHGLIKANDALTMRFLRRHSTRHEDAALLFRDIILQHKIDQKHAPLRKLLTESTSRKSEFDYGGAETGRNEAERWLRDVEKFVKTAREILGVESPSQYR
jgi:uncharacterized protein (UPF0332 family)